MIGLTTAVKPKANPRFKMFEPITLPTEIPATPFHAACNDVKSSGVDVPIEITADPQLKEERLP